MTLDPRLPFPDSVGGIFPCSTTQKVYQGIEWFSQLAGLTMIDSFEHVDCGDNNSGRLAALSPSIMLRNSPLTEGKI